MSGTSGSGASGGVAAAGGIGGAGESGAKGDAGEGGSANECAEPNPAGCHDRTCPDGQTCVLTSGLCIPSSCTCVDGDWACTDDCGGGFCSDESPCDTPNPAGCTHHDECAEDERCLPPEDDACFPLGCACSGVAGTWSCLEDCGGGECRVPECVEGCEASTSPCQEDGVSWVCGIGSGTSFDQAQLLDAGCMDLGTQVPRYCCPATFKPECQALAR